MFETKNPISNRLGTAIPAASRLRDPTRTWWGLCTKDEVCCPNVHMHYHWPRVSGFNVILLVGEPSTPSTHATSRRSLLYLREGGKTFNYTTRWNNLICPTFSHVLFTKLFLTTNVNHLCCLDQEWSRELRIFRRLLNITSYPFDDVVVFFRLSLLPLI